MGSPVDLGHGDIGVVGQDVCILRPLKFVQQLRAQHHVEILSDTSHHFVNRKFPGQRKGTLFISMQELLLRISPPPKLDR